MPAAALSLQAGLGLQPSGRAGVAFKPASSGSFAAAGRELRELLEISSAEFKTKLEELDDSYGYHWVLLTDPDLDELVTAVHILNQTLEEKGYGAQLLCSMFAFKSSEGKALDLVYLYKRGTFYPFAPLGGERRDNELELQVRGALGSELPVEPDLTRWFPLHGAPL